MRLAGIFVAICVVLAILFPQVVIFLIEKALGRERPRPQIVRLLLMVALIGIAIIWGFAFIAPAPGTALIQ
jgi:nitric oxide reductase large subunit